MSCFNYDLTNNGRNCQQKVCVEVKRVFDACKQQFSEEQTLTVSFPLGSNPINLIGVSSSSSGTLSNVSITPQPQTGCSRVQFTLTVPLEVVASDANGNTITGTASISFSKDLLLRVPGDATVPATLKCVSSIVGLNGALNGTTLTASFCITMIAKIVADVDMIIPTYGYAIFPNCNEYTENACSNIFILPTYPTTT